MKKDRTINVNGYAVVSFNPDFLLFKGTLSRTDISPDLSEKGFSLAYGRFLEILQETGIPVKNITTGFKKTEISQSRANQDTGECRYKTLQEILFHFPVEEEKLHRLYACFLKEELFEYFNFTSQLKNPQKGKDAAYAAAFKKAWNKAELLAKAAGAKLGKVLNITEGLFMTNDDDYGSIIHYNDPVMTKKIDLCDHAMLPPRGIEFSADMNVSWELA